MFVIVKCNNIRRSVDWSRFSDCDLLDGGGGGGGSGGGDDGDDGDDGNNIC
jgi:hypothetical protein